MNLFVIPSWYPSAKSPISGIFIKEQIEALAELAPDIRVMVSLWGHADTELPARKPWTWLNLALWGLRAKKDQILLRNGVYEIFNAKIHWSRRLPFGGANQLIKVNRRNYLLAVQHLKKIDLIHAHVSYPSGYLASILSKEFGVPYVLTEHMGPFPFPALTTGGKPLLEISEAFKDAEISVAVSPSLAEHIRSFGYSPPKIIPNMVNESLFFVGDAVGDKTIFLTLCNLTHQKGIDLLLEAIALWNPPIERFEFRIGGDGPLREFYQSKANALGLDGRVHWLGEVARENAPALFRDCHIYVMPSRHETFGIVYAEAIASGKPIIATRCGGPEFIVNDKNGKLVDVDDVEGLSNTMKDFAERLQEYDPKVIRQDFQERFSRKAVVGQLVDLYKIVLGSK